MRGNPLLEDIDLFRNRGDISETDAQNMGPHLRNLVSHAHGLARLGVSLGGPGGVMLAAEVVSGLRANIHHTLKTLTVRFRSNGSAAVHVAEMIRLSPQLSELNLEEVPSLEDVAKASAALKGCSNLRSVIISRAPGEIVDVLAEVYDATRPNPGPLLEDLGLQDLEGLTGETLASLTGLNITKIYITIRSLRMTDNFNLEQWQRAGRYLLQSPPQRTFRIHFQAFQLHDHNGEAAEGLEGRLWWEMLGNGLAELSKASEWSPILDIVIHMRTYSSDSNFFIFVQKAISDAYVTTLLLLQEDVSSPEFKSLVEKLGENTSIRNLVLNCSESSSKDGWELVFSHLRGNTSIRSLELRWCRDLSDDDFRVLMELLQVNFTLQTVDIHGTRWESEGKGPLLEEVLQRNRKQAGYFAILGDAGLPFDGAKAGRVFLCGLPYAGKTQLKVTMLETMGKKTKSESILSTVRRKFGEVGEKFRLKRTRGIEVELLCDDESVTISMWDLAGQAIFRALQSILFPRISQACIFVFVFNPFEGKDKNRRLKTKVADAFDRELRSWLRFVVSNTQITGYLLPQMLVIITHRDKSEDLESGFDLTRGELEDIVGRLKDKFKDVLDLCPCSNNCGDKLIYHINAKAKEEVQSITDLIISCMKDVLNRKSSKVPRACSELVSYLLKSPEEVQRSPLWECEMFHNFCSARHLLLSKFKWTDEMGRRVLHSVASYMHDVGAICMTPSTIIDSENTSIQNPKTPIVVDMNWLTQNFLGELISEGHQFEIHSRATKTYLDDHIECQDGFLDSEQLSNLIEKIMKRTQREGVDRKLVRELLLQLDLCFRIRSKKGVDKFFMPMLFGEKEEIASQGTPLNQLQWRVEPEADLTCKWDHFGFRVQCYDEERTSLTQALFPRYQIHLRKQMEVMGVNDDNFIFFRYHMEIQDNGCIILVEIDESAENHIDIMVKVSKDISRDWAMDHIYKHIVKDLIRFCASEKGCPGLQMVVSLIRTKCVEQLTPRKFRKSQAVLIEDLKTRFQNDIESRLESTKVESNSLFTYSHPWPEVTTTSVDSQFRLPPGFEPAQTLLSSQDFNEVLKAVGNNHPEYWQNLFGLKQVLDNLNDIELQIPYHRLDVTGESKPEDLAIQIQPMPQNLTSLLSRPSFRDRIDVSVGEKLILYHLDKNTHHLEDRIAAGFLQLRDDLRSFKAHMGEMQRQLSDVTCKVDKIIRYKKSKDNHAYPRRPYFTLDDVGMKQKMKATLLFNKAVYLHLMCEARNQPHFVKDQPGLKLWFEKEGSKYRAMRKLSVLSLHMVWVLLKIGVQVTAGLGSVVPDISNLATGVSVGISAATATVVLEGLQQEVDENLIVLKESGSVQEAWDCLRDYLDLTRHQYASLFKLHKVCYRNSDDPFAWLCESCVSSGRRNFLLEKIVLL